MQRESPFLVLALARPEIHEVFPGLWADKLLTELNLKELPRKASESGLRFSSRAWP